MGIVAQWRDAERRMTLSLAPGSRMLAGRFMAIEQTIASPKGRDAAARYVREFIEEAKASGLIARMLADHAVRGVSVSPPARGS